MADLIRHIGKMKNTGNKVVVIFRTIPGNETAGIPADRDHALVVESDSLPDMYQDNLHTVIRSEEGQSTPDLHTVLNRRSFTDGGNMLATLHHRGFMRKVLVDDVIMTPLPSHPMELRYLNNTIDNVESRQSTVSEETTEINSNVESVLAKAHSMLAKAALMEAEAKRLREEAYTLAPETRPFTGKVKLTPEERQRRKTEDNVKRRKDFDETKTQ